MDVFHYHHAWDGYFKSTWGEAKRLFGEIMAEPASEINYVTVLRDPVEHWLSYFYFYFQPEMKVFLAFGTSGQIDHDVDHLDHVLSIVTCGYDMLCGNCVV